MAIRYDDKDALYKYLAEYLGPDLKGKVEDIPKSLERLHPLNSLRKQDHEAFKKSLDGEQRLQLEKAIDYWKTTLRGNVWEIKQAAGKVRRELPPVAPVQ
jgi:hypothetical protein